MSDTEDLEPPPIPRDPYRAQRWVDTVTANVVSGIALYVLGALAGIFPRSVDLWAAIVGIAGYFGLAAISVWMLRGLSGGQLPPPRQRRVAKWIANGAFAAILAFEAYRIVRAVSG